MKNEIDAFQVVNTHIEVHSKSGSNYIITKKSCSCKGFSFHRNCRHFEEASKQGLIQMLIEREQAPVNLKISKVARQHRQEALKSFLKKFNIEFSENQIIEYEPLINQRTKPEEVINYFKG